MADTKDNAQTSSLQDFSFNGENDTFFGIKTEEGTDEQTIKEVKSSNQVKSDDDKPSVETTDVKDTKTKDEEKSKEKEPKFFDEKDEEEDDESKEEEEEEDKGKEKLKDKTKDGNEDALKDDAKFFTTLSAELKERGILANIELEEGKEYTEEEFFTLHETEIEKRIEETFEAFFEEMDEDGKAFLKFKRDGGKTSEFLATFQNDLDIDTLNEEDPNQVNQILNHYLSKVEGLDSEELKDRMAWLKETGKEKVYAAKYFKAIEEDKLEAVDELTKAQAAAAKKKDDNVDKFNKTLQKVLTETEAVGEFTLTAEDKKKLGSYITKPSVKVGKNKFVPAFQYKVAEIFRAETPEAQQRLILLAKLVESDFDIKDVVIKKKTEITKASKSKLQEAKNSVRPTTSGGYGKKSLGDFF